MARSTKNRNEDTTPETLGLGQLSLVEHALCPLDTRASLSGHLTHKCQYRFVDQTSRYESASVCVHCPEGLSPSDEFYLWGLLAITFESPDNGGDLHVTRNYVLRRLGVITNRSKGGKNFQLFRQSLRRLSAVRYQNDRFYDPIRREHRQVSFGFFSYSLPLDPDSSRAWRIVWDPMFFEICQAAGSRLQFELELYRRLDHASRRLFLLLHKVFWRRVNSPCFELRHLAVNVLGFSASLTNRTLKAKVKRCAEVLLDHDIITVSGNSVKSVFQKQARGTCSLQFHRGAYFKANGKPRQSVRNGESPLREPLETIGFDKWAVARILRQYSTQQIQLWSDVTLAAIERKGTEFFRRSPQAFFMDNIKNAAEAGRTPPDWFWALRKEEDQRRAKLGRRVKESIHGHKGDEQAKSVLLPTRAFPASAAPASVVTEMTAQFRAAGQSPENAQRNADRFAAQYSKRNRKSLLP